MAVTIREQPHPLDFAGNRPRFLLKGTPVATAGSKSRSAWRVNALPSSVLTVGFGDTVLDFQITSPYQARDRADRIAGYNDTSMLKKELQSKIAEHYTISRHYDVTLADDLTLTFLSKEYGGEVVTIDGNGSGNIEQLEQVSGVARVLRPNYGVFARFEVTRYSGGAVQTLETPDMILHLDADDLAELPLDILRSYFTAADVPSLAETFAAYPLQYATLKFRLTYSDVSGEIPQVGVLKHSQEAMLSAGRLDDTHQTLNLADWETDMGAAAKLSEYTDIRDFGSPTGLTVRSYAELPQYAYFLLFNTLESASHSRQLNVGVIVRTKDGGIHTANQGQVTVANYNIVRLPLSVAALGLDPSGMLSYTVSIRNESGAKWTRTYVLGRKPIGAQEFLLQSRYGLLESLSTDTSAVEEQTDGSDTVKNGVVGADITDTATVHTARTGYRTAREIQLVADAMRSRHNYRIIGGRAVPIAVIPDTLTVTDTAEDLMEAEFQYRFNKPATTTSTGNLPALPNRLDRWDDVLLWVDDLQRNAARQNEIANQYFREK